MSGTTSLLILAVITTVALTYAVGRWAYRTGQRVDEAELIATSAQRLAETNRDRIDRDTPTGTVNSPSSRSLRLVKEHHG